MPGDLLNEIAPSLAQFVRERGMRVTLERQDKSSFDNAVVEVTNADFVLRLVRDRGDLSLDVRPPDNAEWHSLENVFAFLGKEPLPKDIPALVKLLSESLDKVAVLMTSDLYNVGFTDFERQRSATFLQKLFPPT